MKTFICREKTCAEVVHISGPTLSLRVIKRTPTVRVTTTDKSDKHNRYRVVLPTLDETVIIETSVTAD